MQSYTDAQTFAVPYYGGPATLVVDANGGSVQVEVLMDTTGNKWITQATYAADGAYKLEANGLTLRFTPTGGAEFAFVRP